MKLIRGLNAIKPKKTGCVATIGNFDGLHLGHQKVINKLKLKAKEIGSFVNPNWQAPYLQRCNNRDKQHPG